MNNLSHIHFSGTREPSFPSVAPVETLRMPRGRSKAIAPARKPIRSGEPNVLLSSILSRASLPPDAYRINALERRLAAICRRLRVTSVEEAKKRILADPVVCRELLDVLLIGVTGFFRDLPVFEALRRDYLPAMTRQGNELNILSAGSSRGHELYSVAILLEEAGVLEKSRLLGVDCRPDAVAQAQEGVFPEEDVQRLDPLRRQRYFQPSSAGWTACWKLRERLRWRVENILFNVPSGPWDIVLFRNVAIYLEPLYAEPLWERLCQETRPGGIIVAGKADQPPPSMPLQRLRASIYRRTEQ